MPLVEPDIDRTGMAAPRRDASFTIYFHVQMRRLLMTVFRPLDRGCDR
jgi:hypothetical protein